MGIITAIMEGEISRERMKDKRAKEPTHQITSKGGLDFNGSRLLHPTAVSISVSGAAAGEANNFGSGMGGG